MIQLKMILMVLLVGQYTVHLTAAAESTTAPKCPLYFGRGDTLLPAMHNGQMLNIFLNNAAKDINLDGWPGLNLLPPEKRLIQLKELTNIYNTVQQMGADLPDDDWMGGGKVNMAKTWNVPGLKMGMTFSQFHELINNEYEKVKTSAQKDPDNVAKVTENLAGCFDERSKERKITDRDTQESTTAEKCPLHFGRGDTLLSASHNKQILNIFLNNAAKDMYVDGWASLNLLPAEKRLAQLKDLTGLFNTVQQMGADLSDDHWIGGRANMAKTWHVAGLKMNMTFDQFLDAINEQYAKAQKSIDHKVDETLEGCSTN